MRRRIDDPDSSCVTGAPPVSLQDRSHGRGTHAKVLRRLIRSAIPLMIFVLGICMLEGCFFIPTFNYVEKGRNYSKQVGEAQSKLPLRVGLANRQDVIRLLGPPQYASADGLKTAYVWKVVNGIWVFPFCFGAEMQRGNRALLLQFDRSGVLTAFRIVKNDGNWYAPYPTAFFPALEGMRPPSSTTAPSH